MQWLFQHAVPSFMDWMPDFKGAESAGTGGNMPRMLVCKETPLNPELEPLYTLANPLKLQPEPLSPRTLEPLNPEL